MKITAEFNSNEELLSFISTFGAKTIASQNKAAGVPTEVKKATETQKVEDTKEDKKETPKAETSKEEKKEDTPKVDAEVVGVDQKNSEVKDAEDVKEDKKEEDPKVTKEMVRERIGSIMKAGKQKEAKELVAKYGAIKLPDLKEEHYAAIYKDAETLL